MTESISFANPSAGAKALKSEILASIERVIDAGHYILGPEVEAFEMEFAEAFGATYCTGVASGTDALELALRGIGVGPSDEVITVSHTAVATVAAIERCGATPVLVDIDPLTMTMSPPCLETALAQGERLSDKVKAILPVHLYGQPADMRSICRIADHHGIPIVEDCAQAHGARIEGQPVGSFGNAACYSFYPTKNIGALGDGGAVTTDSKHLQEKIRSLRQYGWSERYISSVSGINSRLDEIQAAVLRIRLKHFHRDLAHRQKIGRLYSHLLSDLPLKTPDYNAPHMGQAFHLYVIRTSRRDALQAHLESHGVGTAVHYPLPVHQQPAYCHLRHAGSDGLPVTETIGRKILSLPMYPELSDQQVLCVCRHIETFFQQPGG